MKIHIVQKGDTLWELSKKYNVDFEQLKAVNSQLTNPDMIMPGMKIKIPTGSVPVKKEAPIGDMAKKEAPKKEMPKEMPKKEAPLPPPAPAPVEAPIMEMPQWQPIQFHQQPITVQQNQHINEWDLNFNVYKPQPQPKPQPKPKMEMPKMPKPPAPPKVEQVKKPEIKPKAPVSPGMEVKPLKKPEQHKPVMPQTQPIAMPKQPQTQPIAMANQPQIQPTAIPNQPQPYPPVVMPQAQYAVPCPPYYPVSPVMPGCGPTAPIQQSNCGEQIGYGQYGQNWGQMWDAPNPYQQSPQQYMNSHMHHPQQHQYQNQAQYQPYPAQNGTQAQGYVQNPIMQNQQQPQQQPYAPYMMPQSPGWNYGFAPQAPQMPRYGQNSYSMPIHEEYDDLED